MKRIIVLLAVILLLSTLFTACGGNQDRQPTAKDARELEQSGMWTVGERYSPDYSSLSYFVTYIVNGEPFCLKVTRNAKQTGMSKRVLESRDLDGIIFSLCESKQIKDDGTASYTYYECYTGSFRYFIGRESDGFYVQDVLSMDDAIALMFAPESPKGGVKLTETEWNAQYRTESCNLELLIRPDDNGAYIKSLSSSYQPVTEDGETYYVSSSGDAIVYTDGTNSIEIRQANRAGGNAENHHTLSECKAILALLKTK